MSGQSFSDLDFYTSRISAYPILTWAEELDLARRYKNGDIEAGQKIVLANLRFVVKLSRSYFHMGYGPLEIIQEGNMGLVKALTRYDPERGVRYICYAIWWIKAYIRNFIHKSYQAHTGRLTHAYNLVSLDCDITSDGEGTESLLNMLFDETPNQEETYAGKERTSYLLELLHSEPPILKPREIYIIKQRFFIDPPATLREIALTLGVTRERVRQIESRSLERIREVIMREHSIRVEDIYPRYTYPVRRCRI